MTAYADILLYALLAFAVSLALPAVVAVLAGIVEFIRARRDDDQVDRIVGDYPAVPTQSKPEKP